MVRSAASGPHGSGDRWGLLDRFALLGWAFRPVGLEFAIKFSLEVLQARL